MATGACSGLPFWSENARTEGKDAERMHDEEEMYKFTVIYRLLMTGEGKFMYTVW